MYVHLANGIYILYILIVFCRSVSRAQDIRDNLDTQALPTHQPPFYVVYDGPIQGVWKRYANIALILECRHSIRFCKAYSWTEVRYVLASQCSFKDILYTKENGWSMLYPILLELFGNEHAFKIGPELHEALLKVRNRPPSLQRVLAHLSSQTIFLGPLTQAHASRRLSDLAILASLPTLPPPSQLPSLSELGTQGGAAADEDESAKVFLQSGIDFEVQMRMAVLDHHVSERSRQNEVEVLSRVIDRLTARLQKLTEGQEDEMYGMAAHNATDY
ncbi:hypothetical protein FRC08_004675 [Ceratobasidium sp. 394]|nr:hypothetical protein FRC08_004675 [Ceratobasidium sp. 394]